MAWRTKFFILLLITCIIGIVVVQEFIHSTWDLRRDEGNRVFHFPIGSHTTGKDSELPGANKILSQIKHGKHIVNNYYVGSLSQPGNVTEHDHVHDVTSVPFTNIEDDHDNRIRILHSACQETRSLGSGTANHSEFFYSREHRFAYCKVPKSGSTFWMKVFLILSRGGDISQLISRMSRGEIHDKTRRFNVDPKKIIQHQVRTVVVSRNPYTRLYSAFVDKVYLPLFWAHFRNLEGAKVLPTVSFVTYKDYLITSKGEVPRSSRLAQYRQRLIAQGLLIKKNVTVNIKPVCVNTATFEQFLKFIIAESSRKRPLEPHWAPISDLCVPCELNTFKIVKQETFSFDIEHTLDAVGIDLSQYDWLKRSLNENRVENSVPGIVAVVGEKMSRNETKMCISQTDVIHRLWKAFQIQGFIRDSIDIPDVFLDPNFQFDKRQVTRVILEAISGNPLSREESIAQRHKHFSDAMNSVSSEVLEQIQSIYHRDFKLFNYPIKPPV